MSRPFLIVAPIVVFILLRLKPFDVVFRTLNTLVHELSHALVALLFKQKVQKIDLNNDFSGTCVVKTNSKIAQICVALAGYTFTSILAYCLITYLDTQFSSTLFWILIAICVVALVFYVRNTFGILWTMFFIALNFIFIFIPFFKPFYQHILYIYAWTLLNENLLSTITLLYLCLKNKKKAGDATLLAKATKIPAIVWAILFFMIAIYLFIKSIAMIEVFSQ